MTLQIQGKPAEKVPARDLRDDDIIARPYKPVPEPLRLGEVVREGGTVRVRVKGQEKWYTFGADDPVLRRKIPRQAPGRVRG